MKQPEFVDLSITGLKNKYLVIDIPLPLHDQPYQVSPISTCRVILGIMPS